MTKVLDKILKILPFHSSFDFYDIWPYNIQNFFSTAKKRRKKSYLKRNAIFVGRMPTIHNK
jgi:hypothetical protein